MRKIKLLAVLVFIIGQTFGQKYSHKQDNSGFISLIEFLTNRSKYSDSFIINKRTKSDIKAWGGSDYKIERTDELITKKIIRKEIWGVYKNDTLYLNGIPITGLIGYAKVEILGKYSFLRPAYPVNMKIQNELGLNDPMYGYMFGAVGGAIQGAQMAVKRIPLVYNMETGEKFLLTEINIEKLLDRFSELKAEFEKESDKKNEEVLLRYLKRLNELDK